MYPGHRRLVPKHNTKVNHGYKTPKNGTRKTLSGPISTVHGPHQSKWAEKVAFPLRLLFFLLSSPSHTLFLPHSSLSFFAYFGVSLPLDLISAVRDYIISIPCLRCLFLYLIFLLFPGSLTGFWTLVNCVSIGRVPGCALLSIYILYCSVLHCSAENTCHKRE